MAASDTSKVSLGDDFDGVFGDFVQERNLGLCTDQQSDIKVRLYTQLTQTYLTLNGSVNQKVRVTNFRTRIGVTLSMIMRLKILRVCCTNCYSTTELEAC